MGHWLSIRWKARRDESVYEYNITYNLSEMYYLCLKNCWYWHIESFWEALNNKKLKDIKPMIQAMHKELIDNPKKYKKLNPRNWRWRYDWLLEILNELLIAWANNPNSILENFY